MESLYLIGVAVLALFAFVLAIVLFNFFGLWLRARIANAPVSLGKMIGMRLRKVPVGLIVDNRITAVKAGLDVPSDPLEAHYLAGGDVNHVVLALIAADKAGISLDFNRACAIDLATKGTGKTVLEAVRTSINPKVIDAPSPNDGPNHDRRRRAGRHRRESQSASDGALASRSIRRRRDRGNDHRARRRRHRERDRLGEFLQGSVWKIRIAFRKPCWPKASIATPRSKFSRSTSPTSMWATTSARNLQTEQADADKRVAQAKAEVRRAAAVAVEQEMRAKTQEMRAKVVEAEALVPQAMAEAFRAGHLGIMDYYRMKNVQADTSMRESIAGGDKPRD